MDKITIKKNLLDLKEKKYRLYFTTQLVVGVALLSVFVGLRNFVPQNNDYSGLVNLFGLLSGALAGISILHKWKADEAIKEIESLLNSK